MESEHKPLRSMCGLETLIPASLIPRTPSTTVYACRQADSARLLNLKHRVESAWQNHFHNLLDNRVETSNPCAICRDWSWSTIFPGSWRKKLSTLYICPQAMSIHITIWSVSVYVFVPLRTRVFMGEPWNHVGWAWPFVCLEFCRYVFSCIVWCRVRLDIHYRCLTYEFAKHIKLLKDSTYTVQQYLQVANLMRLGVPPTWKN